MPTPDSIDRTPSPTYTPVTVYVDPETKKVIRTTDPAKIADLVTSGWTVMVIPGDQWDPFVKETGANLYDDTAAAATGTPVIPGATPLSNDVLEQLNAGSANIDAQENAAYSNINTAYSLSQQGRDRAAKITKEDYGAAIQPTLLAGAFSGAGYHQALGDIFDKSVSRDRSLAELADQNSSAIFQVGQQRDQIRTSTLEALDKLRRDAVAEEERRRAADLSAFLSLDWVK